MFATLLSLFLRRLAVAVPTLFVVSALLFIVLRLLPVDPAAMSLPPNATNDELAAMRSAMGLDKSLLTQFLIWLGQILGGDFGNSFQYRLPVWQLIGDALPATIELALLSMIVATIVGLAGWRPFTSAMARARRCWIWDRSSSCRCPISCGRCC